MSGTEPSSAGLMEGAYAGLAPLAVFRFHGPDRHVVLNGLLTNDIKSLAKGSGVHACLLSPQGKLKAHLFVQNRGEDLLGLCRGEEFPSLKIMLNKYLAVSETVLDNLSEWSCWAVFPSEVSAPTLSDEKYFFPVGKDLLGKPFLAFVGEGNDFVKLQESFSQQGVPSLNSEDLEVWRVEAGLPRLGLDVDETVFPVEANLQSAVHLNKGCYLGQEMISRLTNKGQPRRRLIRLKLPTNVDLRESVFYNDQEVGCITSVVYSPRFKSWLGLALLISEATKPITQVEIRSGLDSIKAEVCCEE